MLNSLEFVLNPSTLKKGERKTFRKDPREREFQQIKRETPRETCQKDLKREFRKGERSSFQVPSSSSFLFLFHSSLSEDQNLTGLRDVVKTSRFCERCKHRCFCTAKTLKRPLRPVKKREDPQERVSKGRKEDVSEGSERVSKRLVLLVLIPSSSTGNRRISRSSAGSKEAQDLETFRKHSRRGSVLKKMKG